MPLRANQLMTPFTPPPPVGVSKPCAGLCNLPLLVLATPRDPSASIISRR